ncbi:MAG: alpha/beta fold hydrolase [Arenicella sp.]
MDDADKIIEFIYETAEEPTLWPVVLTSLNNIYKDNELLAAVDIDGKEQLKEHSVELSESDILLPREELEVGESKRLIRKFLPHFRRSLNINKKISTLEGNVNTLHNIVDQLPIGIITVDVEGNVVGKNAFAEQLLFGESPLFIEDGKLVGASKQETQTLLNIISGVLSLSFVSDPGQVNLPYEDGTSKLSILAVSTENIRGKQECCNLLIGAPYLRRTSSPEMLEKYYGFTSAESNAVFNLVNGLSIQEISQVLGVTSHTVRAHIKSAFVKTRTHSQVELIRLVLQGPTVFTKPNGTQNSFLANRIKEQKNLHEEIIVLRDGRKMSFACCGNSKGIPIVFLHGSMGCRLANPGTTKLHTQLGVRLIIPDRAGYSLSDRMLEANFKTYADDIVEMINYLGYDKVYLVGYSTGGMYAQSFAYYYPELCHRMGLVSSMMPFSSLGDISEMKPAYFKLILALARYSPSIIEPIYRLFARGVLSNPYQYFSNFINTLPEPDKELLAIPGVLEEAVETTKESFRSGVSGIVQDLRLMARKWPFVIEDIQMDTLLWHGALDHHVPVEMVQKSPFMQGAQCNFYEDKGHMFIFAEWEQILIHFMKNKK